MNWLGRLLARVDRVLDRNHYSIVASLIALAVLLRAPGLFRAAGYSTLVELAFTLDWVFAAVGLGVLLHLMTRSNDTTP